MNILFQLIFALIIVVNMPVTAGIVENFSGTQSPAQLHDGAKRNQSLEMSVTPDGRKALRIFWTANCFRYAEPMFQKPVVTPDFEQGVVTVSVYTPENCPVVRFNLRLIDANREVFQWDQAVSWRQAGWKTLTYSLTPSNSKQSWGDKADKKIDFPVKVLGFGIDFQKDAGAGEFWLGSIAFASAGGDKVVTTEPCCRFDDGGKWQTSFYIGQGSSIQSVEGMTVKAEAATVILKERMWNLVDFALPSAVILDARLNAGDATASFSFRDQRNKTVSSTPIQLKSGDNHLVFDLSSAMNGLTPPVRIEQLILESPSRRADLILRNAEIQFRRSAIEAVKAEIITGNPVHVLKAGEEQKFKLQFANIADAPVSFRAQAEFADTSGHAFTIERNFELNARQSVEWSPEKHPERYGLWSVNYILTDLKNKDSVRQGRMAFAYINPAGPTAEKPAGFLFGICTHTERWSKSDQEKEVLAAALCGAKVIRTGSDWGSIQPKPDVWNWDEMDHMVGLYGRNGMELQYIFAFTPRWAAPEARRMDKNWLVWNRSAPELNAWRNFVTATARRYQNQIRYWEVWNEPDLSGFGNFTVEEYVQMQKTAYQAVKSVNPQLQVMTGGFATSADHPGRKDKLFQEKFLRNAKGSFDVHATHEHCDFATYAQRVDQLFLPLRRATGTEVPWFTNETAISSLDGAEIFQAETLFKKLIFAWARGSIGYNWYDLRNDGFDPKDGEHNMGMLTNDFYPKPVYPVYNALAAEFRDMKFERQINMGTNLWAFVFKNRDCIIIPAWNEATASAANHIIIKTDAAQAEQIDMMGNATPVPLLDGMTILEVGATPSSLKLTGATFVETAGSMAEVISSAIAVPGKPVPVSMKLRNPLQSERPFRLKLQTPAGISADRNTATATIPAGGECKIDFSLRLGAEVRNEYGVTPKLKLAYSLDNTPWHGELVIPVNMAILIPSGTFQRKPDFNLNARTQVFSLCAADPSKGHLVWRDANDLSARIWLAANDRELILRAEVSDDVHNQPYSGGEMWQGDGIQFAIQSTEQTGFWEIGLSRRNDGSSESFVWVAPKGFDSRKVIPQIRLQTSRDGQITTYQAAIPLEAIGLTKSTMRNGIRFNLLVNDNDGELREGWINIAPNLGTNKNPASYPFVVFE